MRKAAFSLIALLALSWPFVAPWVQAQTFTVLYSFTGGADGSSPQAGLVRDKRGNLYGTTAQGGSSANCFLGCGVVFKLDTWGNETVLHTFTNTPDGALPLAALVRDKTGNLYGTTASGGTSVYGTIFKLDTTGNESVRYSFAGAPDGAVPEAGLLRDKADNLYGTTFSGGSTDAGPQNAGTVFELDGSGDETVLHSFTRSPDGAFPQAGLVRDRAGNLYGTTTFGGSFNRGSVFKLDTTGNETVLHSFTGVLDGAFPQAGLVMDKAGNFYGTTGGPGAGTVFKLDTSGNETLLYIFADSPDGASPQAGLVIDKAGNIYGTTTTGGSSFLYGTVFKLDTSNNETVLHSFTNTPDGAGPLAGLIMDKAGNLYGTTKAGGSSSHGTVFKLTP